MVECLLGGGGGNDRQPKSIEQGCQRSAAPGVLFVSTFCITCSRCSLSHSETYYVQPKNLAPIVGTEKVASFHKDSKLESYNYKDMVP